MTNLEILVLSLLLLWILIGTILMLWAMYWNYSIFRIRSRREAVNNDQMAIESALHLLEQSKEKIELYDDGNDVKGSLYNDSRFVRLIREKLYAYPEFEVRCFFNIAGNTLFTRTFVDEERVQLFSRREPGQRPESDIQYKIVDSYTAYVSKHPIGAHNRKFRLFDTTQVPERLRDKLTEYAFGKYRQKDVDFEKMVV